MGNEIAKIDFHGQELVSIRNIETGIEYTAIKPICEALGMDWSSQSAKLKDDPKFNYGVIAIVANDGIQREMGCLPVDELNGWLYSINSNRVAENVRPKLLKFQKECTQVLHNHWTRIQTSGDVLVAMAVRFRDLEHEQLAIKRAQTEIKTEIKQIVDSIDKSPLDTTQTRITYKLLQQLGQKVDHGQKSGYGKAQKMFKQHFGLHNHQKYSELSKDRFEEAVEWLTSQIDIKRPMTPMLKNINRRQ